MTGTIEDRVLSDPHILRIEPAEGWQRLDIDYARLDPAHQESDREIIELIYTLLEHPYIVDDFGADHQARREWKEWYRVNDKEVYGFMENNALRSNKVVNLLISSLEVFQRSYQGTDENDRNRFQEGVRGFWGMTIPALSYNGLAVEEKIVYIRSLKEKAYALLQMLAK